MYKLLPAILVFFSVFLGLIALLSAIKMVRQKMNWRYSSLHFRRGSLL